MATQTISAGHRADEWTIRYTQSDVDVIRAQIIEGEAVKRRWLIVGLLAAVGALAVVVVLLSTSYALYAQASKAKESLEKENSAIAMRAAKAEQALEASSARDTERQRANAETQERFKSLLTGVTANADIPASVGGRFAKSVFDLGGRVETDSRPSSKLFRNWKVITASGVEIYSVVGGFDQGKWLIYSNLIGRKNPDSINRKQE